MKGNKIYLKCATCETTGLIYLVKCPCGKVFVGQTIRPVKERIKEHKSDIRNYKLVLEVVLKPQIKDMNKILLQQEAVWIKRLKSLAPTGLNEYWSIVPFL
ncbi:hypothetical protein XELAEV_18036071mg [Xenopus laevis]|uniref:GIY-YIG domain-containing protein n=1 Tax=Xenopus laevis TaxID=8355 RepID=A0A974CHL3_XENLA|nr:hypothetical protein XELAEV_18036071mg [Xenopus laevis]